MATQVCRSDFMDLFAKGLADSSASSKDFIDADDGDDSDDEKEEIATSGMGDQGPTWKEIEEKQARDVQPDSDVEDDDDDSDMKVDEASYATTDDEDGQEEESDEEPLYVHQNRTAPMRTTFLAHLMSDLLRHHGNLRHEELERERVPDRGEDYFLAAAGEKRFKVTYNADGTENKSLYGSNKDCEGDRRVKKIKQLFQTGFRVRIGPGDHPGAFRRIVPSADQMKFLNYFLFSCLPHIYTPEEWPTHCARVLKEWGLGPEIIYFVMVITARRVGKTFCMGIFDTAMILFVPSFTIAVYSTGRRASEMLKDLVEQFVCMTGEENALRIVVNNQEKLFISHTSDTLSLDGSGKISKKSKHALKRDPRTAQFKSYPTSNKGKGKQKEN